MMGRTADDLVAAGARLHPTRRACVDLESGEALTYTELDSRIDACAAVLSRMIEAVPAARVAMLSRNSALMLVANYACIRLGWIFVPLNWRLSTTELAGLVADAEPSLMISQPGFAEVADEVANKTGIARLDTGDLLDAIKREPLPAQYIRAANPDATSTLLYTSGTSGKPKGVMLSERQSLYGLMNFVAANRVTYESVFLCDMPMFHVAGLYSCSRTVLLMGGCVLISEGFDAGKTLARLREPQLGVTHYFCVVQMAQMMRAHAEFSPAGLTKLVALCTGGAPNPRAHIEQWLDDGVAMIDGFGMTEIGSTMSMPLGDSELIRAKAGSVGLPLLSVQARIVDMQERDVPDGEAGELWIRGPNVTAGYWSKPGEEAVTFAPGEWFRTGDIARRDEDGFYYLVDRKKDMFISGGENVYPVEIEAAMRLDPRIADVAVVGVPDSRWGEVGCAYVVAAPGHSPTSEALRQALREQVAHYKAPKYVVLVAELPRNAAGKVLKAVLRDRFVSDAEAQGL